VERHGKLRVTHHLELGECEVLRLDRKCSGATELGYAGALIAGALSIRRLERSRTGVYGD
jgi:hypothetical protein